MKKRVLPLLLALAMCLSLGVPTIAAEMTNTHFPTEKEITQGFDTISFTSKDYVSSATKPALLSTNSIKNTVVAFLSLNKAYVRDCKAYCQPLDLVVSTVKNDATIKYRLSESQYQAALNDLMGWEITKDKLSFSAFDVSVSGNTATAKIVEDYSYFVTDNFEDDSFRRREYSFTLLKENNIWKITSVKTNDPWELDENFSYPPIDVERCISDLKQSMNQPIISIDAVDDGQEKELTATALYRWEYSVPDAVAYAVAHVTDTSNSVFGFTTGSNCQNFASQCVWAGLGGAGTSTSARPAVSQYLSGANAPNLWQRNQYTSYYGDSYWLNWTWDNTCGFAHMLRTSITTRIGPLGNTVYVNALPQTIAGNVLEVSWNGSPARDTLDHAMFVTAVSGTAGNRTTSDIKIAAHTNPTNSAYQTLSSYTSVPASYYARVGILAGYYDIPQ